VAKKSISSPFKRLRAPLSYEKTDAELEASTRVDVEKWMAGFKKAPPSKKSARELEAKHKMLRSLAEPKKPLVSNYKCTMQNLQSQKSHWRQMRFYRMRMNKCSNFTKK
jgi:hypothetical protein